MIVKKGETIKYSRYSKERENSKIFKKKRQKVGEEISQGRKVKISRENNKDHILYYFKFHFSPSFFNYCPFKQILLEKKV